MESKQKSGYVAIIGRPNVGKSTLLNSVTGQKVAITANKPQTTRTRIPAVLNDEQTQIVFLDTPGIHKAKNRLGAYMVDVVRQSLREADVILWLVEPSSYIGAGEEQIIKQLHGQYAQSDKGERLQVMPATTKQKPESSESADGRMRPQEKDYSVTAMDKQNSDCRIPVILVINKIDTVKKELLYRVIDAYRQVFDFAEIVPVSAHEKDNLDTLLQCIRKHLPLGKAVYDGTEVSLQPKQELVAEIIREKALHALNEEIPHGIAVVIEGIKRQGKLYHVQAVIVCERDSHKGIIIGKGGAMLKKIGTNARYELEQLLKRKINLELWVKVKKDWRDNEKLVRGFGYRAE